MKLETILVPTDFSDGSEFALIHAADLAKKLGARLRVLHVLESIPILSYEQVEKISQQMASYQDELVARGKEELEKVLKRPELQGLSAESMLRIGYAPDVILEAIADIEADLVVMTTHGRTGFAHALVGSIAEKITRAAPCPVLSLKAPDFKKGESDAEPAHVSYESILFPTDLSELSLNGFEIAIYLAEKLGATIDVLYVMEDPANYPLVSWEYLPAIVPEDFYRETEERARENLNQALAEQDTRSVEVRAHVKRGFPYQEITRFQEAAGNDLIIMSTHGRTGLKHLVLGSVSEKIVRKAHCSVLTVRG